jgi:hypothetical protein
VDSLPDGWDFQVSQIWGLTDYVALDKPDPRFSVLVQGAGERVAQNGPTERIAGPGKAKKGIKIKVTRGRSNAGASSGKRGQPDGPGPKATAVQVSEASGMDRSGGPSKESLAGQREYAAIRTAIEGALSGSDRRSRSRTKTLTVEQREGYVDSVMAEPQGTTFLRKSADEEGREHALSGQNLHQMRPGTCGVGQDGWISNESLDFVVGLVQVCPAYASGRPQISYRDEQEPCPYDRLAACAEAAVRNVETFCNGARH